MSDLKIDIPESMEVDLKNSELDKGIIRFKKQGCYAIYDFVYSCANVIRGFEGMTIEAMAHNIDGAFDCACASDRETPSKEESGVRDNLYEIYNLLEAVVKIRK